MTAVPLSPFFFGQDLRSQIRFCFAKTPATLDAAVQRLHTWAAKGKS